MTRSSSLFNIGQQHAAQTMCWIRFDVDRDYGGMSRLVFLGAGSCFIDTEGGGVVLHEERGLNRREMICHRGVDTSRRWHREEIGVEVV